MPLTHIRLAGSFVIVGFISFISVFPSSCSLVSKHHSSLAPYLLPKSYCSKIVQEVALAEDWKWNFNSGNADKTNEINELFQVYGSSLAQIYSQDLREIDASDLEVAVHKASQMSEHGVFIEDSALDVDGESIGPNIKWYMNHIDRYIGKKATLHSLIGYRIHNVIFVIKKSVDGRIVAPRGQQLEGSRLSSYFQPIGSSYTLAEEAIYDHNPRAKAVKDLIHGRFLLCSKPIYDWSGSWQSS